MTDTEPMTEDEFYALPEAQHTIWCDGHHDRDGECINEVKVSRDNDAAVLLNGVPTDHQYIQLDGVLISVEEIDATMAILAQMRERFAAQDVREIELQTLFNERVA